MVKKIIGITFLSMIFVSYKTHSKSDYEREQGEHRCTPFVHTLVHSVYAHCTPFVQTIVHYNLLRGWVLTVDTCSCGRNRLGEYHHLLYEYAYN